MDNIVIKKETYLNEIKISMKHIPPIKDYNAELL